MTDTDPAGWRAIALKLAAILRAEQGWDTPTSRPADRATVANYAAWVATVDADRLIDAEPTLTHSGHLHLWWVRAGYAAVDIGPRIMSLHHMAPDLGCERSIRTRFDAEVLTRFFTTGEMPEETDDAPAPCRTDGCTDDPDDGEGWDGYCGNCADRLDDAGAFDNA